MEEVIASIRDGNLELLKKYLNPEFLNISITREMLEPESSEGRKTQGPRILERVSEVFNFDWREDWNILALAAGYGHIDILSYILSLSPDLSFKKYKQRTVFHCVAENPMNLPENKQIEVIELLLAHDFTRHYILSTCKIIAKEETFLDILKRKGRMNAYKKFQYLSSSVPPRIASKKKSRSSHNNTTNTRTNSNEKVSRDLPLSTNNDHNNQSTPLTNSPKNNYSNKYMYDDKSDYKSDYNDYNNYSPKNNYNNKNNSTEGASQSKVKEYLATPSPQRASNSNYNINDNINYSSNNNKNMNEDNDSEQRISYITKLLIDEKDRQIAEKESVIARNEQIIANKDIQLAEKDRHIAEYKQLIAEKDRHIAAVTAEKDRQIAETDRQIAAAIATIAEKDRNIAEYKQLIGEKDRQIADILSRYHEALQSSKESEISQLKKREIKREIEKNEYKKKEEIKIERISNIIGNDVNLLQITKKLGEGCDGIVFHSSINFHNELQMSAIDELKANDLAVKVLYNMGLQTRELQRFKNEFDILIQLQRKKRYQTNIIRIFHHFQSKPSQIIFDQFPNAVKDHAVNLLGEKLKTQMVIMPFHPTTLYDLFRSKIGENNRTFYSSLSLHDKLMYCYGIGKGIKFLFKHRVIHRDMKLNNILLSKDGEVIICDFGVAIRVPKSYSVRLEAGSSVGGNPIHLAPEVVSLALTLNSRSVLVDYSKQPTWEFALLTYEILFGLIPELTSSSGELLNVEMILQHASRVNLSSFALPLAQLLIPMLRVNPGDRLSFPDAFSSFLSFLSTHFQF